MMNRRDWFAFGAVALTGLLSLALAIPGVAYLLTPLRRREEADAEFHELARLGELPIGVPRSYPIIEARQDAWVQYPPEPIGSVWLIRRPEGSEPPVLAFTAECPHLGCAVNLAGDARSFLCPCHTSSFSLEGERLNKIPPRGMDALEVAPIEEPNNPESRVLVKFQRFRTMIEEKKPLA
ncbi:hypothetical protein BH23PLA1_BH23PLA1_26390 [soil metagenome]